MTQQNEMNARALSMEELENVNGGKHCFIGDFHKERELERGGLFFV